MPEFSRAIKLICKKKERKKERTYFKAPPVNKNSFVRALLAYRKFLRQALQQIAYFIRLFARSWSISCLVSALMALPAIYSQYFQKLSRLQKFHVVMLPCYEGFWDSANSVSECLLKYSKFPQPCHLYFFKFSKQMTK